MELSTTEQLSNHLDVVEASIGYGVKFITLSILVSFVISFFIIPILNRVLPNDVRSKNLVLFAILLGGIVFFSLSPIAYFYIFLTASGLIALKRLFLPHF